MSMFINVLIGIVTTVLDVALLTAQGRNEWYIFGTAVTVLIIATGMSTIIQAIRKIEKS